MTYKPLACGHAAAFLTIVIWGTTFISTKVLLRTFSPIEILFIRFVIGYIALWCVYPKPLKSGGRAQELVFAAAGLCGITLYYLFENIALTYTLASNVGVIISVAPFFTAIFGCLLLHEARPDGRFFAGFLLAMVGVTLISFSSETSLTLSPIGDLLAVVAAIIWAAYSLLTKKIASFGYHSIQATRRTFFYGLLFMLPVVFTSDFQVQPQEVLAATNLLNLLFLGLGASALCFVTWNFAVRQLGPVKTSVYIYMVPVITAAPSALILSEPITGRTLAGIALTLVGLFLSESKKIAQDLPAKNARPKPNSVG